MKKKILGIGIMLVIIIFLLINTIIMTIKNTQLEKDNQNILLNGNPVLEENIELLSKENINLKKQLEMTEDETGTQAIKIVSEYLELFYKRNNTQPKEIYENVSHLITQDVLEHIGFNTGTEKTDEMVYETDYGDNRVIQGISYENSFYKKKNDTVTQVLSDVEVFTNINGEQQTTRYIYEFEVTKQEDNKMIISKIVQEMPVWEVG